MAKDKKPSSRTYDPRSGARDVREELLVEGGLIEARGDRSEREFAALVGELSALDQDIESARATPTLGPMTVYRRETPAASVHGERLTVRDGAELVIRPVEPGDALQLEAGLEHLSAVSRYRRFRAPIRHYSPGELDWLTHVDHVRHEALVALEPHDGTIVGVARYVCDPDAQADAHVTYVVADGWQHRGVGTALIDRLAAHARAAGVERWTARMLVGDDTARRLIRRVGAELGERREAGVVEVTARI